MAEEKEALSRIADSLEKLVKFYEHPEELFQRMMPAIQDAVNVRAQVVQVPALPEGAEEVTIRLSNEEKEKITGMVMTEFERQAEDFKVFIADALREMPEKQLKQIGEHLMKGEKFKLRRRKSCLYLDFGYADEEFFVRL